MRGGPVIILVGLTALIAYAVGRNDAPRTGPATPAIAATTTKPVAFVEAPPQATTIKPQPSPSPPPQPAAKPNQSEPAPPKLDAKRKVEVVLTAAAIAAILIQASRDQYHARGKPCACPDDLMRNGRRCGGNSAHSRAGGAAPLCYPSDITGEMIEAYRKTAAR